MNSEDEKSAQKWLIKFKFKEEYTHLLIDLKYKPLFYNKYPVFKMRLARDILELSASNFFHVKREEQQTEIKDPSGKEVPIASCIFILGISKELGVIKLLFFPQPEERLVLAGLDEVWIKVLENIEEEKRMTVLTNVLATLVKKKEVWSQVYLIY